MPFGATMTMTVWERAGYYAFGWAARMLVSPWLASCRPMPFGTEIEERYFAENPGCGLLYATWHRGLIGCLYYYRNRSLAVMASASSDGELAAQAARRFGWVPVRGSSTRRGGIAVREMQSLVDRGHSAGIVVDAPTGPAHVSKPGIVYLSKLTGRPILPVMWSAERFRRVNSWDRTILPRPFTRLVGLFGDRLIQVPADADREACEIHRRELDAALNRLMYRVDRFFTTPGITDPRQIPVPEPVPVPEFPRRRKTPLPYSA
jgi:lysophospholipid acyltransferase (LPLAT)-like uncharacterized protein